MLATVSAQCKQQCLARLCTRLVIPTASPRLLVHINATLLSTDFAKIWLFHINPGGAALVLGSRQSFLSWLSS